MILTRFTAMHLAALVFGISLVQAGVSKDVGGNVVENLKLTHPNEWSSVTSCPPSTFVKQLRVMHGTTNGQTLVNRIEMTCSRSSDPVHEVKLVIKCGRRQENAAWGVPKRCKTYGVGISVSISQKTFYGSDLLDLALICPEDADKDMMKTNSTNKMCKGSIQSLAEIAIRGDTVTSFEKGETVSINAMDVRCKRNSDNEVAFKITATPVGSSESKTYFLQISQVINYKWARRSGVITCNPSSLPSPPNPDEENLHNVNCSYSVWVGLKEPNGKDNYRSASGGYSSEDFPTIENTKSQLVDRVSSSETKGWFHTLFPHDLKVLDNFVDELLSTPEGKNYTGSSQQAVMQPNLPAHIFPKLKQSLGWKQDVKFYQFVARSGDFEVAFPLFRLQTNSYLELEVDTKMIRFTFDEVQAPEK